uniref:septum site-determining protein Ssd n=1 Tax=Saccharothrix mutabilis TaxID=33921 RepID=UPI0031E08E06
MSRVVALVAGTDLLDEVLQAAAVAGCEVERVVDVPALRGHWHTAPAVVVDPEGAKACVDEALPRRPGVLLVATGPPDPADWPCAVELGVERVIDVSAGPDGLRTALADLVEAPHEGGRVLAVLGGCGGAGASVLATAVGQAVLLRGRRALLVDCDPLGGGLDLALGAEAESGVRWPEVELSGGRVPASALRTALPWVSRGGGTLSFLSCSRSGPDPAPQAVAAVVEAGRRAGESVVCDVPRQLPPAACAALDRADLAVLVVPAEVRACAAARRVADQVAARGVGLHAVVRAPGPGGIRPVEVAEAVGVPLLTAMRAEPRLPAALDHGRFPLRTRGPLAKAAREVLSALDATVPLRHRHVRGPDHRAPVGGG